VKKPRFFARMLDSDTVKRVAPSGWLQWRKTTEAYRGIGYQQGKTPPESGDLLVQSPYTDYYNLVWGLAPPQDMPKWRWMYRARPEIRRGIDTKVILAVGRGFTIVCEQDKEVEDYSNRLVTHLNIRDVLQSAVTDMLVYGQAYFEKVRAIKSEIQEHEKVELTPLQQPETASVTNRWTTDKLDLAKPEHLKAWIEDHDKVMSWMAQNQGKQRGENGGGELVELKPLDPLWMRVNRDAFNNIIGFVQWGLTPIPQSTFPDKIVFLRWLPKSWSYESAYGTSMLMPVSRHVSLLIQAEEDMKVYWHQYAKPMLVVKAGTPESPYPLPTLTALRNSFAARQPNTDAIVPGNVDVDVLHGAVGETSNVFKQWADYLREKIYETLGIPSVLMNMPDQTSRATSDVSLQAFIAEERMIQDVVGEQILKQLIEPEVRDHFTDKFSDTVTPRLHILWPPILEEDRNRRMDRIIKATGVPFMSVNEARIEMELIPRPEPQYTEIAKAPMPGAGSQFSKPEPSEDERVGPREESLQKRDRDVESAD